MSGRHPLVTVPYLQSHAQTGGNQSGCNSDYAVSPLILMIKGQSAPLEIILVTNPLRAESMEASALLKINWHSVAQLVITLRMLNLNMVALPTTFVWIALQIVPPAFQVVHRSTNLDDKFQSNDQPLSLRLQSTFVFCCGLKSSSCGHSMPPGRSWPAEVCSALLDLE